MADCLVLVTNCFSTQTSYENQTKKAITNKFMQEAMTEFFRSRLHVYFIENKHEADKIADQVLVNKRSREYGGKGSASTSRRSCIRQSRYRQPRAEICRLPHEGCLRSARFISSRAIPRSAPVKLSRDAEFQGIMPVRGKILNCLKADYDRIFKSEIITDLITRAGLRRRGAGEKGRRTCATFDLSNLRWNKVVICTDADVDGYQIRTLILTMIYRLCPTLIQRGLCLYRRVAAL